MIYTWLFSLKLVRACTMDTKQLINIFKFTKHPDTKPTDMFMRTNVGVRRESKSQRVAQKARLIIHNHLSQKVRQFNLQIIIGKIIKYAKTCLMV